MKPIVECVPNFSEGRNPKTMDSILEPFQKHSDVKLLDVQHDADHNRMVVTVAGAPDPVSQAVIQAIGIAVDTIDMTVHTGQHPRMGAVDVVPFIPIRDMDMQAAIQLSEEVARKVAEKYQLPVFLYEESARHPWRTNLSDIRKGQFEAMAEKMTDPKWKPDFGPDTIHPTAGVTAIGARWPLIAFNVNLNTHRMDIAQTIAQNVRHLNGGLRFCKAIGVELADKGMVQVSMNLTNYMKTPIYRVFELIRIEAQRYGVSIAGSEIVGLTPMDALLHTTAYYLGLENFSTSQVLETRIME